MTERLQIIDGDADTADVAAYETSRREALRRGFGLGGKVVAAATIPLLLSTRNAFAVADGDAAVVLSALRLEQLAVLTYRTVVGSGILQGDVLATVTRIAGQEQQHVDGLAAALKQLGGAVPTAPDASFASSLLPGLGQVKTEADVANFAIAYEEMAVAAYYDAHKKLQSATLLATGAAIMANEGQHLTILRALVNQNPVPNAFEVGKA